MKKLMVMLAGLALAGMVQASTVNWSYTATSFVDKYGKAVQSGSVFVYVDSTCDVVSGNLNLSGELVDSKTFTSGSAGSGSASTSVNYATTSYSLIFTDHVVDSLTDYEGYLAFVNGDVKATGGAKNKIYAITYTTSPITLSTYVGGTEPSSVPEPTSGMLLLVGGALLALRRRHA